MDQATETADLTETEKFLKSCSTITTAYSSSSSESDDEEDPAAQGALLGGIRCGLNTMTKTARNSLSTCKNKAELDDAIGKIQASSLNLLKMEKSFLKTATIVSEVVDDLASDFEDDAEPPLDQDGEQSEGDEVEGAGDASIMVKGLSRQKPYVFCPSKGNLLSFERFREKLKSEYHKRMEEYKATLTDDLLKEDKKFEALLQQIKLGKSDAETAIDKEKERLQKESTDVGQAETDELNNNRVVNDNDAFLSSLPYTAEDLKDHHYKPYDEDEELDDSVLPSVDPISKGLIAYPVKNKYCNHVFDRASISAYISGNPDAKCPVHMCQNKRNLKMGHFQTNSVLTDHVRRKNNLDF